MQCHTLNCSELLLQQYLDHHSSNGKLYLKLFMNMFNVTVTCSSYTLGRVTTIIPWTIITVIIHLVRLLSLTIIILLIHYKYFFSLPLDLVTIVLLVHDFSRYNRPVSISDKLKWILSLKEKYVNSYLSLHGANVCL